MKENSLFKDKKLIITLLVIIFFSSMYYYADTKSIIRQGINVWKALFEGDFFHYYSINTASVENGEMIHNANYGMIMNILMGLWQLPLYFIEKIFEIHYTDYLILRIYGKLYTVAALIIAMIVFDKLLSELKIKKRKDAIFVFITSIFTLVGVVNAGQVDIISIIFIILAFYYIFKNDVVRFLIFYIIAAQCKNFALFIFVPVILYFEKNLIKSFFYIISPFIAQFIIELPFKVCDPIGTSIQDGKISDSIKVLTSIKISLFSGVPLFYVLFFALCLFAYLKQKKENDEKIWEMIIGFIGVFIVFSIMDGLPYWYIYLSPFVVVFVFSEEGIINNDYLIYFSMNISFFLSNLILHNWIFTKDNMVNMLAGKIIRFNTEVDIIKYYAGIIYVDDQRFFYISRLCKGIMFVCILTIVYRYFLRKIKGVNFNENTTNTKFQNTMIYLGGCCFILITNIPLFISMIFN